MLICWVVSCGMYSLSRLPGSPDLIAEAREFANTMVLEVRQELLRPRHGLSSGAWTFWRWLWFFGLFGWFFLAIALAVRLSSKGPVFFGQERIGARWEGIYRLEVPQHGCQCEEVCRSTLIRMRSTAKSGSVIGS